MHENFNCSNQRRQSVESRPISNARYAGGRASRTRSRRRFGWGLLGLVLLTGLQGCFLLGPGPNFVSPEVKLSNLYFKNATLFETLLVCTVRIDNENPDDVNLDGGTLKLYLNDLYVGKGFLKESVTIPKFSSTEAEVEVALSNLTMLSKIVPIVESPEFSYRIDSSLVLGAPYAGARVSSTTKDTFQLNGKR